MLNSIESYVLVHLKAAEGQKVSLTSEATRIAQRCRDKHAKGGSKVGHEGSVTLTNDDNIQMAESASDVVGLMKSNQATNGANNNATEVGSLCHKCYDDFLAKVHETYTSLEPEGWYLDQQKTFLTELDRLLEDARSRRIPLRNIDEWIENHKRVWLQEKLREMAVFKALESVYGEQARLKALLTDPDTDPSELLRFMVDLNKSINDVQPSFILQDAESAVEKLRQSSSRGTKGTVYRDTLFPDGVPDVPAIQDIEKSIIEGKTGLNQAISEIMDSVVKAENYGGQGAIVEKHKKRLAELRRAKAAHEAQKLKRMKPVEVPYFLQGDAPCTTCGRSADPQKSPFCIICFLEVDFCLRENQTVWCSLDCMKKNYATHFAATHPCAAGDRCARSKPEPDIVRQEPRYFFCRECVLSFSISTVYCNDRCAGRDFQKHRESTHLPNREIRADHHDDQGELSYSSTSKSSYTATDIATHLMSIDDTFLSCQKKHPDWALTESKVQLKLPWST